METQDIDQIGLRAPSRKKHHYIPVFYLKQWVGPDGKLCEFSRPYKTPEGAEEPDIKSIPIRPRRTSPDGAGYIKNLYTFPGLRPELVNYLEDEFFLRVDDQGAAVMQRLLQGDVDLDSKAKSAWSRFLMSMFYRSPENVKRITETVNAEELRALEAEFRPHYEAIRVEHGGGPTYDEMIDGLTDAEYQEFRLRTLRTIMDSKRVGEILNSMIWTVSPRQGKNPFFTSDRPIFMTPLGPDDAHLIMPLTPDRVFFAAKNPETLLRLETRNEFGGLGEIINNKMVRQARTYVYATDDSRINFLTHRLGDRQSWSPLE